MINLFEIKELSSTASRAKPVIAEIDERGCWKIISHAQGAGGYVRLTRKQKDYIAHRLSYQLFVGPIPDGMEVLHRCDTPPCVNPEHLFLGTHADNMSDMVKKGRQCTHRGVENGRAKLNDVKVREIKILVKQFSQVRVAKMFGVNHRTVHLIAHGKRWSHVYIEEMKEAKE